MSFLDNLENNLKALEGRDEGLDDSRKRETERERRLEVDPPRARRRLVPAVRRDRRFRAAERLDARARRRRR